MKPTRKSSALTVRGSLAASVDETAAGVEEDFLVAVDPALLSLLLSLSLIFLAFSEEELELSVTLALEVEAFDDMVRSSSSLIISSKSLIAVAILSQ